MRLALALFALLALAGCGSSSPQEPLPLLPASALPGLESSTQSLDGADLAADFGSGASFAGFVAGSERVFQGESHDLDRVVSRTVEFESDADAMAYVEYLRAHVADLYGAGTTTKPFENRGRTGYLVDPAACACHRAAPTLTGAVAAGPRVTYLEINGDGATPAALDDLLAQAP